MEVKRRFGFFLPRLDSTQLGLRQRGLSPAKVKNVIMILRVMPQPHPLGQVEPEAKPKKGTKPGLKGTTPFGEVRQVY